MKQKTKKPLGIILWSGKSLLDGERIMVIATGIFTKTENRKTGDMIQTWILRRDINPMLARRLGEDKSICGNCKHKEQSTCYVNIGQAPMGIYNAYQDGRYRHFQKEDLELFRDRSIRIGSYGDPSAVNYEVWENICAVTSNHTAYTHQWDNKKIDPRLKNICMASVDTIKGFYKEYEKAQSLGWRTFRVRESLDNPLMDNEFVCPASKEAGALTQCEKCGACGGFRSKTKKSVTIVIHADSDELGNWRYDRFMRVMKKRKAKKAWRRDYETESKKFKEICRF